MAARGQVVGVGGHAANTRRFELYVLLSLYVLLAFEMIFAFPLLVRAPRSTFILLFVLGMAVQVGLNILVCRWSVRAMRRGSLRPRSRATIGLLACWAAVTVALVVAVPHTMGDEVMIQVQVLAVVASPVCATAPALGWRPTALAIAAATLLSALLLWIGVAPQRGTGFALGMAVSLALYTALIVISFWLSGWMLRVVWQLDAARGQAAALAIAEERLRIARDLHDVFGRTLATVAVKSELAAELARRGRTDAAAAEIGAVRAIADDAGREVRQVVNGFRAPTLATELAGSQSLLASAGVRCVVEGAPPPALPPVAAEALAWTLREAVTNVIRHSQATECTITITATDPVRLLVSNDGVGAPSTVGRGRVGHGLTGMAERVAPFGGTTEHRTGGGRFVVDVRIPLPRRPMEVPA